jgi:hypothetical protein
VGREAVERVVVVAHLVGRARRRRQRLDLRRERLEVGLDDRPRQPARHLEERGGRDLGVTGAQDPARSADTSAARHHTNSLSCTGRDTSVPPTSSIVAVIGIGMPK